MAAALDTLPDRPTPSARPIPGLLDGLTAIRRLAAARTRLAWPPSKRP